MTIHDDRICLLGEGPLWHPEREELFWFDILGRRLHGPGRSWTMDRIATAAGWIDRDRLLVATKGAMAVLNLADGSMTDVHPFLADAPHLRPNDGRADPQGGFWIGAMGLNAETGAGHIARLYKGEMRILYPGITIPNSICFAPDGRTAYFADTTEQVIRRVALDADGWPAGDSAIHIDLRGTDRWPDGSVVDADGTLWNAQWGAARVAAYDTAGRETAAVAFPAAQTSCPAFGGPDLQTLFCTSAAAGIAQGDLVTHPDTGRTFAARVAARGQREHRVIL